MSTQAGTREEPGLIGSTEWAETHEAELQKKAVLYVNSDTNGRGFLFAGGSHSYQHLVNEVGSGVLDPETGASIMDRLRARIRVEGVPGEPGPDELALRGSAESGGEVPLDALGSGSDYTPFLQHVGIASINLGFRGEDVDDGIYHSNYDSFDHFIRFGDPKLLYGVALAETAGRLVLRTADADVLPMRFGDLAATVGRYVADVTRLADTEREDAIRLRLLIDQGAFKLAANPDEQIAPPRTPGEVPRLDFSPLARAAARLRVSAAAYDAAFDRAEGLDYRLPPAEITRLNELLQGVEQTLTSKRGLPGREWYRHMLYAPGLFTGYAAKTLPAVRESVEERRWADAVEYIHVVADVINATASRLDEAAVQLSPRLGPGREFPKPTPLPAPDG